MHDPDNINETLFELNGQVVQSEMIYRERVDQGASQEAEWQSHLDRTASIRKQISMIEMTMARAEQLKNPPTVFVKTTPS